MSDETPTSPLCTSAIPFETLVDLWTGDLPREVAETVEAHLFSCDPCAQASDRLGRLVRGLQRFIPPVISHAHRDRLMAGGVRILETPVSSGVDAHARFSPDVDLLVHALNADLSRAERVDVELLDAAGVSQLQLDHVPFDRDRGEVLIACQRHYETLGAVPGDPRFLVHAYENGIRRSVGSYFVRHQWR